MTQSKGIVSFVTIAAALLLLPGRMAAQSGSFAVGHATRLLDVTGTRIDPTTGHGETRHVNVHLWYPAPNPQNCQSGNGNGQGCPPSVYTSRLNGIPLLPQWDPLSWTIGSTQAFEELPVNAAQSSYPVIIFSHGHQNNAIDYACTLEALASFGFIVAAPDHVNDTQDDVRIDFINAQARSVMGPQFPDLIPCFDGLPSPCAHTSIAESMTDRVRDVSAIIHDGLPIWFGSRADTSRIGVMGHSRGSVTALAAAGGSTPWGISPVSGVKAVMGLAIGELNVTKGVDLGNVAVPTQLVAGSLDPTLCVSQQLVHPTLCVNQQLPLPTLGSTDKGLVTIQNAKHRHFDSGLCAQTQSSGAIAKENPRAILDLQTVSNLLLFPSNPTHGVSMDFCGFDTFTNPSDITPLVFSLTGFNVTPTNVPTTGLDSNKVKDQAVGLARDFFGRVL